MNVLPENEYLNHIRATFPELDIQDVQINREGMVHLGRARDQVPPGSGWA